MKSYITVDNDPLRELSVLTTRQLRARFLDANMRNTSRDMLDCAAHLMLNLDRPEQLLEVGIGFMARRLGTCRADAAFGTPADRWWNPTAVFLDRRSDAPSTLGKPLPNRHRELQLAWQSSQPLRYDDIETDLGLGNLRPKFRALRAKSMLSYRLAWRDCPLAIVCLDHTTAAHEWQPREVSLVSDFCDRFLAPLAAVSQHNAAPQRGLSQPLTGAEMSVVRLAAQGLTYKEIAARLGRSIHTVDSQFRSARARLNARNQAELIRRCEDWL